MTKKPKNLTGIDNVIEKMKIKEQNIKNKEIKNNN